MNQPVKPDFRVVAARNPQTNRLNGDCPVHGKFLSTEVSGKWTGCYECAKAAPKPVPSNYAGLIHNPPLTRPALCDEHGDFIQSCHIGDVWLKCPLCHSAREQIKQNQIKEVRRARQQDQRQKRLDAAGIPKRFAGQDLETFCAETAQQEKIKQTICSYRDDFSSMLQQGRCLIMVGNVGTGKSHLAAVLVSGLIRRGHSAVFVSAQRAIRRVRDTWSRDSAESESDALKALSSPDLLVLDDVGMQYGSDSEKNILFEVINERSEAMLPTVITSNLQLGELKDYLSVQVTDRLKDNALPPLIFNWESHRKIGKQSA